MPKAPEVAFDLGGCSTSQPRGSEKRGQLGAFHEWVGRVREAGMDVGLITNNHFFSPAPGSPMLRALADEMWGMLESYACEVERAGREAVTQLDRNGRAMCSLPNGNVGMLLFQRAVRHELESSTFPGGSPRIAHWSVFNPVEATDADRMRRVLAGEEMLYGRWVRSVHIFRQIRDEWCRQRLGAPPEFAVHCSDEPPPCAPCPLQDAVLPRCRDNCRTSSAVARRVADEASIERVAQTAPLGSFSTGVAWFWRRSATSVAAAAPALGATPGSNGEADKPQAPKPPGLVGEPAPGGEASFSQPQADAPLAAHADEPRRRLRRKVRCEQADELGAKHPRLAAESRAAPRAAPSGRGQASLGA